MRSPFVVLTGKHDGCEEAMPMNEQAVRIEVKTMGNRMFSSIHTRYKYMGRSFKKGEAKIKKSCS